MMRFRFQALQPAGTGEADLRLYSEIGDSFFGDSATASDFASTLDGLGPVSRINLYVNSPGGDVFDAQAMMNTLNRNPAPVRVIVDGLMASAATFFLGAADEVVMGPSSEIMIHDAWSAVAGNAQDMRKTADVLDMLSDQIADIYAGRAGGDPAAWRGVMRDETWFNAQEAVDAGLADRIDDTPASSDPSLAGQTAAFNKFMEPSRESALAQFEHAGRAAAGSPVAAFAALKLRPVTVGPSPQNAAVETKERTVPEITDNTIEKPIDGNAIDKLLELKFNAFESKNTATNEAAFQKFLDALEPAPTVAEVKTAVLADMRAKSGPTLRDLTGLIAARASGKATDQQVSELQGYLNHTHDTVFRNAFTYGSGSTNEMAEQFVGDLLAKGAWNSVVWDLINHDDLTGPTVYGGAATTLPEGGAYAGGGAAVSSTAPVWAQESLAASRYAIAAGLDRINFDFGQAQAILNSFFGYAVTDYFKWRDTQAITAMLGSSTGFFGALSAKAAPKPPSNSILQDAVSKIAEGIISVALSANATASFAAVTSADFTSLLQASEQQAPAFWSVDLGQLTSGSAAGKFSIRLDATGTLTSGQVLVGAGGPGMTGYELGGGAVRVEQVVTATGTVDTGLFGYVAPLRTNANYFALVTSVATS